MEHPQTAPSSGPGLAFRSVVGLLIFFLIVLQDPLLAAVLELRAEGTAASQATVLVGDEIDVELWIDSENQELSGTAIFLSFDDSVFDLVDEDRSPAVEGFQPFATGDFLQDGEVFRNTVLDSSDPAASQLGEQLDYSIVRVAQSRGSGAAARFRLKAKAPAENSLVRIDESGIRETRVFTPDGDHRPFRFIKPMSITVQGIGISGLPSELVLERGQIDSTTFDLDRSIFDPIYQPPSIDWTVSQSSSLSLDLNTSPNRLVVAAPITSSLWERVTITATNPDGQTSSFVVDVFVNAAPELPEQLDEIKLQEDSYVDVHLNDIVVDPDAPSDRLTWSGRVDSGRLSLRLDGPPHMAHISPDPDWSGTGVVSFVATDEFGFADSTAVRVSVAAVNDPPRFIIAPNLQIVRGRKDSSLVLHDLLLDAEDDLGKLQFTWSGEEYLALERSDDRLYVEAPIDWEGTETILLRVEDTQGLSETAPLTVTVVGSLPPVLTGAPVRLGISPGEVTILDLAGLATDPDDRREDLRWTASGQTLLRVQLSASGAARIKAPADFSGTETLLFSVVDPTGKSAAFELLVFEATPGGEPMVTPIPPLSVPRGGVDASIDLDDFVFDADHDPDEMVWFVPTPKGVEVRIDLVTHVLSVAVSDSAAVSEMELELRVLDPDGNQASRVWTLSITDPEQPESPEVTPRTVPELVLLPALTIRAGEFDRSVILDEHLPEVEPGSVVWEISGSVHTQVFVDPENSQLTILADEEWSGRELLSVRGTDLLGNVVDGVISVDVVLPEMRLSLREVTGVAAFAGDTHIKLAAVSLIESGNTIGLDRFSWEATGSQPVSVKYDAVSAMFTLTTNGITQGNEIISLTGRDGESEVSGRVSVVGYAADGSFGVESDQFRLVVVPNPVQPDYLDMFVISEVELLRSPRIRAYETDWSDLPVGASAPGIWHGDYVIRPEMDMEVSLLALSLDSQQKALKAFSTLSIGTTAPTSAKVVSSAGARVHFDAAAFSREAVVVLIPTAVESPSPDSELLPGGDGLIVHSPQTLEGDATIFFDRVSAHGDGIAGLYRWNSTKSRWVFLPSVADSTSISAPLGEFGRYALLLDDQAPRFAGVEENEAELRFHWTDGGSGLGPARVIADGAELPASAVRWVGDELVVSTRSLKSGVRFMEISVADRSGNLATAEFEVSVATSAPLQFALAQNYPNPFNPGTLIPFSVPADLNGPVELSIYNATGQQIRLLVSSSLPPGRHELLWDGMDDHGIEVSSGVYLYRIDMAGMTQVRRMTLLR